MVGLRRVTPAEYIEMEQTIRHMQGVLHEMAFHPKLGDGSREGTRLVVYVRGMRTEVQAITRLNEWLFQAVVYDWYLHQSRVVMMTPDYDLVLCVEGINQVNEHLVRDLACDWVFQRERFTGGATHVQHSL